MTPTAVCGNLLDFPHLSFLLGVVSWFYHMRFWLSLDSKCIDCCLPCSLAVQTWTDLIWGLVGLCGANSFSADCLAVILLILFTNLSAADKHIFCWILCVFSPGDSWLKSRSWLGIKSKGRVSCCINNNTLKLLLEIMRTHRSQVICKNLQ